MSAKVRFALVVVSHGSARALAWVHVDERASLVLGEEGTYLDIGAQRDWKAPRERLHNPEDGSVFAMVGGVTARQHGRRRWLL